LDFLHRSEYSSIALVQLLSTHVTATQILLTMGLQRETAGRGSMAIYTQVLVVDSDINPNFHSFLSG
jgi:hypothetical protein